VVHLQWQQQVPLPQHHLPVKQDIILVEILLWRVVLTARGAVMLRLVVSIVINSIHVSRKIVPTDYFMSQRKWKCMSHLMHFLKFSWHSSLTHACDLYWKVLVLDNIRFNYYPNLLIIHMKVWTLALYDLHYIRINQSTFNRV
jgi:hypothetical protein